MREALSILLIASSISNFPKPRFRYCQVIELCPRSDYSCHERALEAVEPLHSVRRWIYRKYGFGEEYIKKTTACRRKHFQSELDKLPYSRCLQ